MDCTGSLPAAAGPDTMQAPVFQVALPDTRVFATSFQPKHRLFSLTARTNNVSLAISLCQTQCSMATACKGFTIVQPTAHPDLLCLGLAALGRRTPRVATNAIGFARVSATIIRNKEYKQREPERERERERERRKSEES